ncbi:MAG: bifunctional 2-polyprenyl-6-hydroxyphenol methylase/3-demethylubiquinol 3-O-methyltransferase UbiG [Prochloraceae cyanobacterium]|nr:bifunctional 2-polyprenyl-6-hydroxyphenol methylase/3-demethylubiquinol 3-O-methyltransferase UbiG [Prochloraceae cyanobacterium]
MVKRKRNDLEFYDRVADQWWDDRAKIYALHHLNLPRFQYFDRYITNWDGLKVLDVGCGGGFTCEFLAARGAIVSGIDQSQNCIAKAREHAQKNSLTIEYKNSESENLPYEDSSFDAVICVDVLEHVSDLKQSILEIDRVLKPGGFFGFDTINRTFKSKLIMIWLLEDILRQIPQGIHDWEKFIKPEELTQLLQENNLGKIDIKGFNIFGESLLDNISTYFYYQKTKGFQININNDLSVMYIGKAEKKRG